MGYDSERLKKVNQTTLPQYSLLDEKPMRPTPVFPEAWKKRSQDMEKLYCPTGAVWIAEAEELKRQKTFYGKEYTVFPLNCQNAIDIDDIDDFKMAEAIKRHGGGG